MNFAEKGCDGFYHQKDSNTCHLGTADITIMPTDPATEQSIPFAYTLG